MLKSGKRFVYYLITKKKYSDKPTYDTLRGSLQAMAKHCEENNVTNLSMPMIGCGLDMLVWDKVSAIITEIFGSSNMTITIYSL